LAAMLRQWRWNDLALLDQKGFRTDVKEIFDCTRYKETTMD